MRVYSNVLEMVGNTPMLELKRLDAGPCRLFLKLELMNPGGSIKDRIGLSMIEEAERRGDLKPGATIVEATAGNTGLGLALVAAQKGYRLVLVIPDKMSQEKIFNLRAMGAEVVLTRSDVAKGHPEYYQDLAKRMAEESGAFFVNQFGNPDNVKAHETTTGPEIWRQMEQDLDAVVVGVGSSGTLTGIGHYFMKTAPHVEMVLADPKGSVLADYIKTGKLGEKGGWLVEGIGEDFIPDICDLSVVKHAYTIPDSEAFETSRDVLRKEGLLLGSSSGVLIAAALRYCRAQKKPKRVVTLGADTGNKYLSKLYNDFWMIEQGFMARPRRSDLGDYVGRPYWERATVYVGPADTLATAHTRMRNNGISQLPVMNGKDFLGAVTEIDIIQTVQKDPRGFTQEVRTALDPDFPRLQVSQTPQALFSLLETETAVAVMDGDSFLGLVTRSDLLNRLRLQ
ncbi:MAG TPA: pyridoxal-phosphate dependent enzyme [Gammaproteobacteria bacterium]|nr:pyridoxal-phosphate dependent enzyme [Gammaproteobacteria bacterium]